MKLDDPNQNAAVPEKENLLIDKAVDSEKKKVNGTVHADGVPEKQALVDEDAKKLQPDDWDNVKSEKKDLAFTVKTREAPKDRFMMVYLILMLHGIGTLMPWNMFITATDYFTEYKLVPPAGNVSMQESNVTYDNSTNITTTDKAEEGSLYRNYFLSYLGFTAQIPNLVLNFINVFCQVKGGNISLRIIWSIIIVIIFFILTMVLAMIDSSQWIEAFFWITMVSVVIINMANGVYQNSVYGTAAILPMRYTNAIVLGSNISGTLTSVLLLVSSASTPDVRTAAIYYFLAAIVVLLLAFDTYFALPFIPFYRYYKKRAKEEEEQTKGKGEGSTIVYTRPPFLYIFKQCWVQYFGVFFVFFVTLSCFPAVMANIKRSSDSFPIPDKFYTGVTCFLFFNAFAMLGNLTTEFIRRPGPRWVWIPIVLRVLFIPFFMFCNFQPKSGHRSLPVIINNDYVYCLGSIVMAFTSGYFSSLTMMYAPKQVKEPEYAGVAGMLAAFFLISGIFGGVIFSFPVTIFIENVG